MKLLLLVPILFILSCEYTSPEFKVDTFETATGGNSCNCLCDYHLYRKEWSWVRDTCGKYKQGDILVFKKK